MLGEGILFLNSASLDPHNPPKTSSWTQEAIHHTQKALEDQNIDRVHHLKDQQNEEINYSINKIFFYSANNNIA